MHDPCLSVYMIKMQVFKQSVNLNYTSSSTPCNFKLMVGAKLHRSFDYINAAAEQCMLS
jgi:hypothetical protein